MKRILITISILVFAFLLGSCNKKQHIGDIEEGASIKFTVDEVQTRGNVLTTDNLMSMAVFCFATGTDKFDSDIHTPNWMYNAEVSRTSIGSPWEVKPPSSHGEIIANYNWKDDGYHTFFAVAPYGVDAPEGTSFSGSDKKGYLSLDYAVPTLPGNHIDLLYSSGTVIDGKQMYIGSKPIPFKLNHALAKITFAAQLTEEYKAINPYDTVVIDELIFTNLYRESEFRFRKKEKTDDVDAVTGATWWYDPKNKAGEFQANVREKEGGLANIPLTTSTQDISNTPMFLIPQNMENRWDGLKPKLTVIYKVTRFNVTETLVKTYDHEGAGLPQEWKKGKGYKYNFVYNGDALPSQSLTCVVSDWVDKDVDGNVPGTYLNVLERNITVTEGNTATIYFSTDGSPVTASCTNNVTLTKNGSSYTFPTSPTGTYVVTIEAGILSAKVTIKVI